MVQPAWTRTANGANKSLVLHVRLRMAPCQSQHQCHFWRMSSTFEAYCTAKWAWQLSIKFVSFMSLSTVAKIKRFNGSLKIWFENENIITWTHWKYCIYNWSWLFFVLMLYQPVNTFSVGGDYWGQKWLNCDSIDIAGSTIVILLLLWMTIAILL